MPQKDLPVGEAGEPLAIILKSDEKDIDIRELHYPPNQTTAPARGSCGSLTYVVEDVVCIQCGRLYSLGPRVIV